jgi:DNA-binding beta-propeller fold protein YncE
LGRCEPIPDALAVSPDGRRILVVNLENDSVSLLDLGTGPVVDEQDLRPGIIDRKLHGRPGGSFPRAVAWVANDRAYVAGERDREVIELRFSSEAHSFRHRAWGAPHDRGGVSLTVTTPTISVARRLPVPGQPVALLANRSGSRLFAALSITAKVLIIDTARNTVLETVAAPAPRSLCSNSASLGGASSNALALTADEHTLLVSNGGENAIAVIRLGERALGERAPREKHQSEEGDDDDDGRPVEGRGSAVVGLVPTGWYPTGVATSRDGVTWYVINGKSDTGANVPGCSAPGDSGAGCNREQAVRTGALLTRNQFVFQLEKAGFLTQRCGAA